MHMHACATPYNHYRIHLFSSFLSPHLHSLDPLPLSFHLYFPTPPPPSTPPHHTPQLLKLYADELLQMARMLSTAAITDIRITKYLEEIKSIAALYLKVQYILLSTLYIDGERERAYTASIDLLLKIAF